MSELYDDVHAADRLMGRDLLPPTSHEAAPSVEAVERGVRERPDGTREAYERIEFRREPGR